MKGKIFSKKAIAASLSLILLSGPCLPVITPQTVCADVQDTSTSNGLEIPGEDSILAGIRGKYIAGQQAALDRINELRMEACTNGYPDPRDDSRALTMDDYVPIKWSSELEQQARIRAAEAVVYASHSRPGSNILINRDPDDTYEDDEDYIGDGEYNFIWSSETLAWPGGTLTGGVNQWYGEKEIWVGHGDGVTGHYTSMIDPDNTYVGLGGFMLDTDSLGSNWSGCVCGHFLEKDMETMIVPDGTMAPEITNVIQPISIKKEYLSGPEIKDISDNSDNGTLDQWSSAEYAVVRQAQFSSSEKALLLDLDSYAFSSSDQSVLKIDKDGKATALKKGTAVVTATGSNNAVYTKTIKVDPAMDAPKLLKLSAGKKRLDVTFNISTKTAFAADGFQVQVASDRKFTKNVKKSKMKKQISYWDMFSDQKKTVKKLKARKTYYVRVRAYADKNGKTYYSNWSNIKKKKTLK